MANRRGLRLLALSAILGMTLAGSAHADVGDLTYRDCLSGTTATGPAGSDACRQTAAAKPDGASSGLDGLNGVVVAPDGGSIHAIARSDYAVASFDRPSAAIPEFSGCISGRTSATTLPGGDGPCAPSDDAAVLDTDNSGLDLPEAIAISPDGRSVYAASAFDDAISTFVRGTDGTLVFAGCLTGSNDVAADGACVAIPTATTFGDDSGLGRPVDLVVSPDGQSVYVASEDDDALAVLSRAADGSLAFQECLTGSTSVGPVSGGGSGACDAIPAAAEFGQGSGMADPRGIAVSPVGRSVYLASDNDSAIASFVRESDGGVTLQDCLTGDSDLATCNKVPAATPDGNHSGLQFPFGLTVDPDGGAVRVAMDGEAALTTFDRRDSGVLVFGRCVSGDIDTGPAGTGACDVVPGASEFGIDSGLSSIRSVSVSPDGRSAYATAGGDGSLASFSIDDAGRAAFDGCITGEVGVGPAGTGACSALAEASVDGASSPLDDPVAVAVSPDGRSVYAASRDADALATFDRELPAGATAPDATAPQLTLDLKRKQASKRVVKLRAQCDEACTVDVSGRLRVPKAISKRRFRLGSITADLSAGTPETLRLRIERPARKAVKRAFKADRSAKVTLEGVAEDAAGNGDRGSARVKLKPKQRRGKR